VESCIKASIECKADAITLQETNISQNKIHQLWIHQIFHSPTGHTIFVTTSSSNLNNNSHQQGGTFQALVGTWVSRAVASGHDKSGLGRWSYIKIQGKADKRYIILSGTVYAITNKLI